MAEQDKFEINPVEIADIQNSVSEELTEEEQAKVTGGFNHGLEN
jgi:hypothetical protein